MAKRIYYCNKCWEHKRIDKVIDKNMHDLSMQTFNRDLCTDCQKEIRNHISPYADKLYKALFEKGFPVKQEWWDGYKHIDIVDIEANVHIEVDGLEHQEDHEQALLDLKRTFYSFLDGCFTLIIPNSLVNADECFDETVNLIEHILNECYDQYVRKLLGHKTLRS